MPGDPNLFVVGAPKCGTTAVYEFLRRQSWCFMPAVKEPHYFAAQVSTTSLGTTGRLINSETAYRNLYVAAGTQTYRGDASTSYLHTPGCADAIHRRFPNSWILVYIRDPTDRAVSHYWNMVRDGTERRTFEVAIAQELDVGEPRWSHAYVRCSLYADAIEEYQRLFGSRVYVGFADRLRGNWEAEIASLSAHLGVPETDLARVDRLEENVASLPRGRAGRVVLHPRVRQAARRVVPVQLRTVVYKAAVRPVPKPAVDDGSRQMLGAVFSEDASELRRILGVSSLPWGMRASRAEGAP
jgi:hypothetical protein